MIVVLLGPPGSGKGTQAKKLVSKRQWPQLSTGDMLRSAIAEGSELGIKAKTFMDKGLLVPDEVVVGLIAVRSTLSDSKNGFVLDGFPRTIPQAAALDLMLKQQGRLVNSAVLFKIPDSELVRRLSGRRTCLNCGSMFHIESLKPKKDGVCDKCGQALVQRDDDKVEVIQKRLSVYHQQTEPLTKYYETAGKLKSIDATQSPEQVSLSLEKAFS
jgi:adenylate kinase